MELRAIVVKMVSGWIWLGIMSNGWFWY